MKYYFIAGEASGDLHASNLIRSLFRFDKEARARGFGGELMEQAGMDLTKHYREMAFMGFIPVLLNLSTIKNNFKICEQDLLHFSPDVLILVDYPGFNLRMARFAREYGIRVFYYISPKIWAWKSYRIKKIKAYVDEMFTILPFETDFYRQFDYPVNYVGNPVLDAVSEKLTIRTREQFFMENHLQEKPVIAVLPGSRLQEIRSLLPRMLDAVCPIKSHQVIITAAPNIEDKVYADLVNGYEVALLHGKTYDVLQQADVAVLASGTVSLEAGVIRCPQVVCYRMAGGALFFKIGQKVLKIKWVSLVNLILQRSAVCELLQHHCNAKNIREEVNRILFDQSCRDEIAADYDELHRLLGSTGASDRAASMMIEKLGGSVD